MGGWNEGFKRINTYQGITYKRLCLNNNANLEGEKNKKNKKKINRCRGTLEVRYVVLILKVS